MSVGDVRVASMKTTGVLLALPAALLALSACSTDPTTRAGEPAVTVTVTATATATATVTVAATVNADADVNEPDEPRLFPRGYPKVVPVSSLPFQVKASYEDTYTKAVALAPGVWTPLAPGATKMDAATAGVADGFCGSIRTYERKFLDGQSLGGSCW